MTTRLPVEDAYELSPAQDSILFSYLYARDADAYVVRLSCELIGEFDRDAFVKAWRAVVARHPALRTSFHWQDLSKRVQLVHDDFELPLRFTDLSTLDEADRATALDRLRLADRGKPFALERAPLFRLTLARTARDRHVLLWSFHTLISDGWSSSVLLNELMQLYREAVTGRRAHLPPARPFRDFITWIRRQNPAAMESEWREALRGFSAPTILDFDRASPSRHSDPSDRYDRRKRQLDPSTTERLLRFVREARITLNTLVQAAWAFTQHRHGGGRDVVFGSVVSGRPADLLGVETIVGSFLNTIPVRVSVDPDASLHSWLEDIQRRQARHQYGYSPSTRVQQWSEVHPDLPLLESIVLVENMPVTDPNEDGGPLRVGTTSFEETIALPLALVVVPGVELELQLSHNTRRFSTVDAQRLLDHVAATLDAMTSGAATISDLPALLLEDEAVLKVWNDVASDPVSTSETYPRLFRRQALLTPDAVALRHRNQTLTYDRLRQRQLRLAAELRRRGAGRETLLAVLAERTPDLVALMLAAFESGAAFLLLDPRNPPQRQVRILERSRPFILLADESCRCDAERILEELPSERRLPLAPLALGLNSILDAATEGDNFFGSPAGRRPEDEPAPENLAYVLFTSGSTGEPKGAMIEHRSMLNHMRAKICDLDLRRDDIVAQTSPVSFNIVVWQCLAPLLVGASVTIIDDETANDPRALWSAIRHEGVSVVQLVPAVLQTLLDEIEGQEVEGADAERREEANDSRLRLRWTVSTGDALPRELALRWLRRLPRVPLLNTYGSTECSDDQCHLVLRQPEDVDLAKPIVAIGSPIPGMRCLVLDDRMKPVPVGVGGDLFTSGVGVGRGYIGDGARTAAAFVPDRGGERAYRTGDRVRWSAHGRLEFIGRADGVLKVRGLRIDPGEVEGCLRGFVGVRESVVIGRDDERGIKRLVAYVVMDGTGFDASALRDHLGRQLPAYMIPSVVVPLAALPLNRNGKIDRAALPNPSWRVPVLGDERLAPQSEIEVSLAKVWAAALGLEAVGVNDNFFELGGDSLTCMTVISRCHKLGYRVSFQDMFQHQTIAELAPRVATATRGTEPRPQEE